MLEVWEDDFTNDDVIDNFTVAMLSSAFDSNQSNPLTIEGMTGIGSLTLAFYNLTTNPTSCNAEDNPTLSTKSSAVTGGIFVAS